MRSVVEITIKGILRDRIFHGIMGLAVLIFFIPSVASLSMRQVTELSITLSLSTISFVLLLLSVFLGSTSIWKDIERRYTFSVLSLPMGRSRYIVGKFFGIALFIVLTALTLGVAALIAIMVASWSYPPVRPVAWDIIMVAIFFESVKYVVVVSLAMLVSAFSTSFFLPVFGSISFFLVGTVTQQVYDYLQTASAQKAVLPAVKAAATALYFIVPNLEAFDLKVNAIYAIAPTFSGLVMTLAYAVIYSAIALLLTACAFSRREMK